MSDLMKLIQDADIAAVNLEAARVQMEISKLQLETAKESHEQARRSLDDVIARSEDMGVPRSKLRKLIEERAQVLVASGLIPTMEARPPIPKAPRAPKKSKAASDLDADNDRVLESPEASAALHFANEELLPLN